ncbi:MAG: O-antigen ligase family protein [Actinomycetota bacterium]|nr:O-antigen ligase family protein [Actinomycetota bacterium]
MKEINVTTLDESATRAESRSIQTLILIGLVAAGFIIGLVSSTLPVLIIVGIITGIALFILFYRRPEWGLYLFLILNMTVPQAGLNWNIGIQTPVGERGLHFNFHEIVGAIVFLTFLIKVILDLLKMRTKYPMWKNVGEYLFGLVNNPLTIALILYVLTSILAGFVGMIHGGDFFILVYRLIRTVFFVYIFYLVINIIKTRKQLQVMVIIILITSTLVAGFGLAQKAAGQAWTEEFSSTWLDKMGYPEEVNYVAGEVGEVKTYRVNSTFLHPNVLGGLLVLALPFIISFMFMTWGKRRYLLCVLLFISLLINGSCLFFTGSRAAWIAAGFITFAYGLFGILEKRMVLVVVMAVLLILLLFFLIAPPDFVKKRMTSVHAQEATQARIYQYSMAMDLFMEHPILGLGVGMEGQVIVQNNVRQEWAAVENAFLTYLVSHGIVGLIPFLLIFFIFWSMLFYARGKSRDDPFIYYCSESLILAVLALAMCNMFGAWLLFAIPMLTLFWFIMGMGGSLYNLFREQQKEAAS